jgi:hypothetical protein
MLHQALLTLRSFELFDPLLLLRHAHQHVEMIAHHAVGQHLHATEPRHFAQQQHQSLLFHIIPKGQAIAEAGHEVKTSGIVTPKGLDARPDRARHTHPQIRSSQSLDRPKRVGARAVSIGMKIVHRRRMEAKPQKSILWNLISLCDFILDFTLAVGYLSL